MPTLNLSPSWLDRGAYPFTPRTLALRAGTVHYVDEGDGPTMLFVHGTPTWSFEYRHLIKAFSHTHRCIAMDLLGFGLSERPAGFTYTPEAHAEVLGEFVGTLGLEHITLVVHDYGGPIGLPLALGAASAVDRAVILNSWMWPFDDDPQMVKRGRLAGGAFGRWMYTHLNFSLRILMPSAYGRRGRLTPAIHRQYLEVFRDRPARALVLHALARAINGSREYYDQLWARVGRLRQMPILVIWGMRDTAFKSHQLDRWVSALPNATVVRLTDAGHWPHEEAPEAVIDAIRGWMK